MQYNGSRASQHTMVGKEMVPSTSLGSYCKTRRVERGRSHRDTYLAKTPPQDLKNILLSFIFFHESFGKYQDIAYVFCIDNHVTEIPNF